MRNRSWKALLPLLVLFAAVVVVALMVMSSEPPARHDTGEVPARLVQTATVSRAEHRIDVQATGTVVPAESVVLQPQVAGRVTAISPELEPGALVRRGDVLVQIERTDYEAAVAEAEGQLAQAQADLALERGRGDVAAEEFESFADELDVPVNEALALREPQLATARATVRRDEAALRRARADLDRTRLTAPFDAVVVSKSVDVGAQVTAQSQLAELVAVDRYWVRATLPIAHLSEIDVPGFNAEHGSEAIIRQSVGTGRTVERAGEVTRLFGGVTEQGRLAQVLVRVPDPRARETDGLPLLLDAFVDVTLRGRRSRELIRLPREHLHEGDTVWVFDDGTLDIRSVGVVWRARDHVLIGEGLDDGEAIVTSPLSGPVAGLRLRREDSADG